MKNEITLKKDLAGRPEFIEGVKTKFPESYKEMGDLEDELLHIDMADFARTTVQAILDNNASLVQEHFKFISELFSIAHPELENAIFVSYLENVLLDQTDEKYQAARVLLPINLEKALKELEKHFEKLHEASKNT